MVEHLPNAPITEAIIDIRTQLPAETTIQTLEACHDEIKDRYPNRMARRRWQGQFDFQGEAPSLAAADLGVTGFLFSSKDGKHVTQFQLDGFSFSRLKPYTTWEGVCDSAKPLWDVYRKRARPVMITRLAIRTVNMFEIPERTFNLHEYFKTKMNRCQVDTFTQIHKY